MPLQDHLIWFSDSLCHSSDFNIWLLLVSSLVAILGLGGLKDRENTTWTISVSAPDSR